jgi:hypothetical protein
MNKALTALALLLLASPSLAYEYKLQFTPPSGARGVNVVGYALSDTGVSGLIHYSLVHCSSGRGAHCITTQYDFTGSWDFLGNPTGGTAGAPVAPAPLSVDGTRTVYANDGIHITGSDSAIAGVDKGFVITPSSHYTWQTPNNQYAVIPDAPYTFSASLSSDGDFDLNIADVVVSVANSGALGNAQGAVSITANGCGPSVAPGASCTLTVTYDPTPIRCTPSAQGLVYTTVTLTLATDAGANVDFTQRYTVTGVPYCDAEDNSD